MNLASQRFNWSPKSWPSPGISSIVRRRTPGTSSVSGNLSKVYERGKQKVEVLHHIDLDIAKGDFFALMGPSGSGKTTLLNLIGGLDSPTEGSLTVGMGMRHETNGINVLLGRVTAGRSFSAWRMDGNALFEKPFAVGRDSVDLITSFGIARRLLRPIPGVAGGLSEAELTMKFELAVSGLDEAHPAVFAELVEAAVGEGGAAFCEIWLLVKRLAGL